MPQQPIFYWKKFNDNNLGLADSALFAVNAVKFAPREAPYPPSKKLGLGLWY